MGIKNLNAILKRNAPNAIIHETGVSAYTGKRVAVDVSVYMYKYKSTYGKTWIKAFYEFMKGLADMKCVFVFDSKTCPKEKMGEREKRSELKHKMRSKLEVIKDAIDMYTRTGTVGDVLAPFTHTNTNLAKLVPDSATASFSIEKANEYIVKVENQLRPITDTDFSDVKLMCRALGFSVIDATIEAEFLCALLCHEKKVDAVMTEDTDAYVYLTPVILTKVSGRRFIEVKMEDVLSDLNMSSRQFVDMCIMCGTDYSPSIRGIGPVKAHKLIKMYGSVEEAAENAPLYAFNTIDHEKLRTLFAIRPSGISEIEFPRKDECALSSLVEQCVISPEVPLRRILK